jgi:hypothetical protein
LRLGQRLLGLFLQMRFWRLTTLVQVEASHSVTLQWHKPPVSICYDFRVGLPRTFLACLGVWKEICHFWAKCSSSSERSACSLRNVDKGLNDKALEQIWIEHASLTASQWYSRWLPSKPAFLGWKVRWISWTCSFWLSRIRKWCYL